MSYDPGKPYPYPPQHQIVHHVQHRPPRSGAVAAMLELLPGLFCGVFGIGHIYAGNVGMGLLFMFGFWFVLFINILLTFVVIGFITLPLCWIACLILSPILAANSCHG